MSADDPGAVERAVLVERVKSLERRFAKLEVDVAAIGKKVDGEVRARAIAEAVARELNGTMRPKIELGRWQKIGALVGFAVVFGDAARGILAAFGVPVG